MSVDRFAKSGLHVMAKPIGPICNLDCEYCYYLHKEDLYPGTSSWRMTPPTLDAFIRQYIETQPAGTEEITFAWQGGEPTLLGIEYFQRIVELQNKYQPTGRKIVNSLQTNGVLLTDEWCEFFAVHGFLIGISIDGPADLHDRYRYDKQGEPTFRKVLNGLKLLKKHRVEFNTLVVVNRHNGDHGRRVYTYLRDNGIKFLQFIPIVEPRGVGVHAEQQLATADFVTDGHASTGDWDHLVSSRSVRPAQFGRFLTEVFDEWVMRDVGQVFVQIFDQALSAWSGIEPSLCVFRRECGRALALEHNGDLYSCDHFVEPAFKLGNILDLPIVEMANSDQQREFGQHKQASLPEYCRQCEVRFMCNGECPKNRFIQTPDGEDGLNYLCAGYRQFFNHIDPVMRLMAAEIRQQRPAANVMQRLKAEQRAEKPASGKPASSTSALGNPTSGNPASIVPASGQSKRVPASFPIGANSIRNQAKVTDSGMPGRNDPCPCGSGRKYKKCCLK